MARRGRPRKYRWFSLHGLEENFSLDAQYLKWASANNTGLQAIAATGCPNCHDRNFEVRHDKKHKLVRFHCLECSHETSYRLKMPKPGSFEIVSVFKNGVQVGNEIVDHYHPATSRQRSDALVVKFSRSVEDGRIPLGGEWYVNATVGGLRNQKRFYVSFEEAMLICSWNRMQAEHEKRLRELDEDIAV